MEQKTVKYKRTLRGSVGAGVGALFNGDGKRYYILEHKDASKYHKAGESQKIIIDQVELGRDKNCQVRFDDETYPTVSRRHAAIVKDGDKWKLVQLSKTNSTFLNSRPIATEWYLENGDEIQLSVGGPRIGFIVPQGKQSLVSSIKMTERLDLFRKQALRPYKTAIACLATILVLSVGGLGAWNILMKQDMDAQLVGMSSRLKQLNVKNKDLAQRLEKSSARQDSLNNIVQSMGSRIVPSSSKDASKLSVYENDVFFIQSMVVIQQGENIVPVQLTNGTYLSWTATGFLLSDGRFVTAKHCVENWKFATAEELNTMYNSVKDDLKDLFLCALSNTGGMRLVAHIIAKSPTQQMQFTSDDFTKSTSDETQHSLGNGCYLTIATGEGGCDWAYVNTGIKGSIVADASLSSSLPAGARLEVMGYPRSMKANGGSCLYGSCQTSGRGLHNGQILISGKNYESGNSGGPVFYESDGKYKAVGIVSYGLYESMGGLTPLYNLK